MTEEDFEEAHKIKENLAKAVEDAWRDYVKKDAAAWSAYMAAVAALKAYGKDNA